LEDFGLRLIGVFKKFLKNKGRNFFQLPELFLRLNAITKMLGNERRA